MGERFKRTAGEESDHYQTLNTMNIKKIVPKINISQIINTGILILGIAVLHECTTVNKQDALQKPNIIVILADDLGVGDIQAHYPENKIPTPNLDQLAREGMSFHDAHSSSAVCSPTRYGLLTGRYNWRTPLQEWVLACYEPPLIEKERTTLPEMLKENGYTTACIGKWHLGWNWQGEHPVSYTHLRAHET